MKDNQPNEFYEFGEFRLDAKKRRLWKNGELVSLTPKEFEVLFVLTKRAGSVVEKDDLLDAVWKDIYVAEATLTRNISFLRKKLGGENFIETLPKRGYRFLPAVRKTEDAVLIIEEQTLTRISVEETVSLSEPLAAAGGFPQVQSPKSKVQNQLAVNPQSAIRNPQLLWLAFGAIALTVIGFAVYQIFLKKPEPKTIPVSRVVPFSGLSGRETMPAFSPDGKQIAFAWNGGDGDNTDIYVKLVGAGEPVRVTENPSDEINPVFSPDGRFIAFVRSFSTGGEIFIIPALGGAERKITSVDSFWTSISFAPDGKTLAVVDANAENKQPGVFPVDIETGAKRRLTSPPEFTADDTPRFSPNGKTLSFVRSFGMITQEIFIVPATGSGEARQLTFDKSNIRGAAWSADGKHIIFASQRSNNQPNLWRISLDGGEPELIATGSKNVINPAASPDGKTIAYVEELNDTNIWKISSSRFQVPSSEFQAETTRPATSSTKFIASSRADHSPHIAPDGSRIVFVSDRTGKYEIWIAETNGKNQRQLTDSPNLVGSPRFSPDGKFIAYDAFLNGNGDIFVVSTEGGTPRRLTESDSRDVLPAWSTDGQWIYFTSNRGGSLNLWKMAATGGGEPVQITQQGAFESFAAPNGKEIFYTKARNVAGIWRVSVDGGEETSVTELAEAGYWRYWTVTHAGIYFVRRSENAPFKIEFYDFAAKQIKQIAAADRQPIWIFSGLSASADGKTILYAQYDQISSSIMLAELGK